MYFTGIGDEAANTIDGQIAAIKELGWSNIEMRGVEIPGYPKANFHDIPDAAFDIAVEKLNAAGIHVCCFGSAVANWGKKIEDPNEQSLAEAKRCVPRMQRLGTKFVRIMSYAVSPGENSDQRAEDRFRKLRDIVQLFRDNGIQPVHENCMNYGGMGWPFTLELLEKVPGLKLVFDTANPVFNDDRSKPKPWRKQDPWEFYTNVREHIAHVHIKDATWNPAKNDADYNMPGEGMGKVPEILKDLIATGYDAGISIEPHVAVVFHDATVKADENQMRSSFIDYGRRLVALVDKIQLDLNKESLKRQGHLTASK